MIEQADLHIGQIVQIPFGSWVGAPPTPDPGRFGTVEWIGHWRVHVRLDGSGQLVSANPIQLTAVY